MRRCNLLALGTAALAAGISLTQAPYQPYTCVQLRELLRPYSHDELERMAVQHNVAEEVRTAIRACLARKRAKGA